MKKIIQKLKSCMFDALNSNIAQLIDLVRSGIIHIEFLNKNNETIGSGSGFISDGYLITNNHVYAGSLNCENVRLAWQSTSFPESRSEITLSSTQFKNHFKTGSFENSHDYAILEIPDLKNKNLFNFKINASSQINIGDKAMIL